MPGVLGRGWHRGRVRLDEQPVWRHGLECLALPRLAWIEESGSEGKIRSELHEARHELGRAAVGVQQESSRRTRHVFERVDQRSPCAQAVHRDGAILLGAPRELPAKRLQLFFERSNGRVSKPRIIRAGLVEDPPVDADLTDGRMWLVVQSLLELLAPVVRAASALPRMKPIARPNP